MAPSEMSLETNVERILLKERVLVCKLLLYIDLNL